jgi:integrase
MWQIPNFASDRMYVRWVVLLRFFDRAACEGLPSVPAVDLREGMPFFLTEDGEPLWLVNRWLRSLAMDGGPSPRTWQAYAYDLKGVIEFLDTRGVDVFAMDEDLVDAYHAYRRGDDGPLSKRLRPVSWNRAVTTLDKVFGWAVGQKIIEKPPFNYKQIRVRYGEGWTDAKVNLAKEKTYRPHVTLQWLEPAWLAKFIDFGLAGRGLDGQPDPEFRGRHPKRNASIAEVMSGVGLRRTECLALLAFEWPVDPADDKHIEVFAVPPEVAKGRRARRVWIWPKTLRRVNNYRRSERADVVARATWAPERPLVVTNCDRYGGRIDGEKTTWAELTVGERRRLVHPDGGSPLLFVAADGSPLLDVKDQFSAASTRCQSLELAALSYDTRAAAAKAGVYAQFPAVRSHRLRHSYAVLTLRWLQVNHIRAVLKLLRRGVDDAYIAEILRRHDSLVILRDLLGHSFVATTEVYLGTSDPVRLLTEMELDVDIDATAMSEL